MGICLPFLEWGHCDIEGCRSEHLPPDHPGVLDLLANQWLAHADEGFCMTSGSSFEQTAVDLDDCDECPSPQVCVYPTVEQADKLVAQLRSFPAVRKLVSIGAGEGFLEGQLERRGIAITAVDLDVLADPARYRSMRRYCSSIVRVRPDALLEIAEPESTGLLFVWGAKLPWEAYLARYPTVSLVVIVGDPEVGDRCATTPSAVALEGKAGWKQGRRREHGEASGDGVRGDARLLGQGGAHRRAKRRRTGEPVAIRVSAAVRNEEEATWRGGGQRVRQGGAVVGEERGGSGRGGWSERARQGH